MTADLVVRTQELLRRFHHLDDWTVRVVARFDNPKWRGYSWIERKEILLTPEATWHDALHEIAHALEPDDDAHGASWNLAFHDLKAEFGK